MICTACGMTGHRASTCPLELWRQNKLRFASLFGPIKHGTSQFKFPR